MDHCFLCMNTKWFDDAAIEFTSSASSISSIIYILLMIDCSFILSIPLIIFHCIISYLIKLNNVNQNHHQTVDLIISYFGLCKKVYLTQSQSRLSDFFSKRSGSRINSFCLTHLLHSKSSFRVTSSRINDVTMSRPWTVVMSRASMLSRNWETIFRETTPGGDNRINSNSNVTRGSNLGKGPLSCEKNGEK